MVEEKFKNKTDNDGSPSKLAIDNKRKSYINMYLHGVGNNKEEDEEPSPIKSPIKQERKVGPVIKSPLKTKVPKPLNTSDLKKDLVPFKMKKMPTESEHDVNRFSMESDSSNVKTLLSGIYRSSTKKYEESSLKLESMGSYGHIVANIAFRRTLRKDPAGCCDTMEDHQKYELHAQRAIH